jgi:hypothetical protein
VMGYDFRITLDGDEVTCEFDTPERSGAVVQGEVVRKNHLETITLLEQWLRRWERIARLEERARRRGLVTWEGSVHLLVPDTFAVLGDHLWGLALSGPPGDALKDAHLQLQGARATPDAQIRVRLTFKDTARDLSSLPWEFVHCPDPGFYLAAETNLVLGRYVWGKAEQDIRRTADDKVRALLVLCLPRRPEFAEERLEIVELVEELRKVTALELLDVDPWQPEQVAARLQQFKSEGHLVDVVHLVALCKDRGGRPVLYLPTGGVDDGGDWLDPQPVVGALTNDPSNRPSLVVLHLSDWDEDPSDHFEQLAPAFINAGIPAVLAMQYPMPPRKGRAFVKSIYESLVAGERIGEAVQMARNQLLLTGQPDRQFGTPVLYLQSKVDGSIIERAVSVDEEEGRLEASVTHPSPARAADPGESDVRQVLLRLLDKQTPPTPAVAELREWVAEVDWPLEPSKVVRQIKKKRRESADDGEMRVLCELMLIEVEKRLGPAA